MSRRRGRPPRPTGRPPKLSDGDAVEMVRRYVQDNDSGRRLAEEYDLAPETVYRYVRRAGEQVHRAGRPCGR